MKFASVREFRSQGCKLMKGAEPVLVTRYGKPAGVFLPLQNVDQLSIELRRDLAGKIGEAISSHLDNQGVTEEDILSDFKEFKKRRR